MYFLWLFSDFSFRAYRLHCVTEKNFEIHNWWVCSISMFFGRWIRIWYLLYSITSRFGCIGSGNFCISIENWENIFEQNWIIAIFWMFFDVFVDKESKKTSEWTYHAYLFTYRRFSSSSKNFNDENKNWQKVKT